VYFDIHVEGGHQVTVPLPPQHNAFAYVYDGAITIGDTAVQRGRIALLTEGDSFSAHAASAARFILVAGRPLVEPVARYGPFVMNTEQEIRQAFADFQSGRF
jgi:redox-sensitive bicupin YhaK (pirin superfamily)